MSPPVRAWIETTMAKISRFIQLVAPRAGRGSKHVKSGHSIGIEVSPPVRGRGSKRLIKLEHPERDGGAPQGCGSKHVLVLGYNDALRSPPQEGVDRNNKCDNGLIVKHVAPREGAWIATSCCARSSTSASGRSPCGGRMDRNCGKRHDEVFRLSRPVRGRGSKLHEARSLRLVAESPPVCGAWIETTSTTRPRNRSTGRPPCGGVDRNTNIGRCHLRLLGRPSSSAGRAWIETAHQ